MSAAQILSTEGGQPTERIHAGIVIECPHDMTMAELRKLFPVGAFRYIFIKDGEYRIVRRT